MNLQGWKPTVHVSPIQRSFYDTADFNPRESPKGLEWCYNPALMNAISVELENLNFIEARTVAESAGGSQGQTTFALNTYIGYNIMMKTPRIGAFTGQIGTSILFPQRGQKR